jgi:hypothetical protein
LSAQGYLFGGFPVPGKRPVRLMQDWAAMQSTFPRDPHCADQWWLEAIVGCPKG